MRAGDSRPGFLAVLAALASIAPGQHVNLNDPRLTKRRWIPGRDRAASSLKWASGLVRASSDSCETCGGPLPACGGIRKFCGSACRLRRHRKGERPPLQPRKQTHVKRDAA